MTVQVEEAMVPNCKSDKKPHRQSVKTRSTKNKQAMKNEELATVEPRENGDVIEDQLQVHSSCFVSEILALLVKYSFEYLIAVAYSVQCCNTLLTGC